MIEFIEDGHIYLNEGVIIPSVSDIVKFVFPDQYKGIPEYILNHKASYGTRVHELAEAYLTGTLDMASLKFQRIDPNIKMSINQLENIQITVKKTEEMVCYEGRYAGRYDILTSEDDLVDIKTTAKLHVDNENLEAPLNLQLSLYYMALDKYMPYGFCLWMPKGGKVQLLKVKTWKREDVLEVLNAFEKKSDSN